MVGTSEDYEMLELLLLLIGTHYIDKYKQREQVQLGGTPTSLKNLILVCVLRKTVRNKGKIVMTANHTAVCGNLGRKNKTRVCATAVIRARKCMMKVAKATLAFLFMLKNKHQNNHLI